MRKILLILISIFATCSFAFSQGKTVTGTITSSEDNMSVPGVSILIKGTTTGTVTDFDGNYSISVKEGDVLMFSFIGMTTQEITVDSRTVINVVLETESTGLEEVVVIGYGTVRKKDVTGAVSVVGEKTIEKMKPIKAEEALQGTVSGVNVTAASGKPGAGLNVRIRGISTNGDAAPITIIDGYEGNLSAINPNDIQSITVLKDAQAAIYGTIGANGVILVTTKQGRRNQDLKVDFNSSYGIQHTTRKIPVLNATEYAVIMNESYAAAGKPLPFPNISGLGVGTDWQDELFQTAPIIDNNFSARGGSENSNYSISASDLRQEGIIGGEKSNYNRSTARLAFGADVTKWLKLNTSITYIHSNSKSFNDFGLGSVLFNALNMPATEPIYDADGNFDPAPANVGIEVINPLQQIANTFNEWAGNTFSGNFGLEGSLTDHITATARIGFNTANSANKSFTKVVDYGPAKVFNVGRSSVFQGRDNGNDYTADAFLTYENTFADDHHFTGTFGTTAFKTWGNHLDGTGYDVPNNSWDFADIVLANGLVDSKTSGSWEWDQRRLSYFSRLQYDFQGKYLMSAMLRRDASTKFGPDKSVAYFPSATLGWNISEEGFMADFEKVSLLKFRMSYGILGSDKIQSYRYISQLDGEAMYVFDNALTSGRAIGALANPSVKWEQSEQFDVGFDLKLMDDKIDITADYFIKNTNDLLIPSVPVSGIFGTYAPGGASPTMNAGGVRNNGVEFSIAYRGIVGEDFRYRINYNVTALHNEVTKVDNETGFLWGGSFSVGQVAPSRMEVGQPIGYFYGYETDGIFQTQEEVEAHPSQLALGAEAAPGDLRFKDTNGDGVIDTDDKTYIGDPIPDFTMGLNLSFDYKSFDFLAYAYVSLGNDVVRNYERTQSDVNKLSYTMDRWTGPGTSSTVPRAVYGATANTIFSDYYVEDGSFLRLQRISLGYKLPKTLTQRAGIEQLRFFVAVNNLVTFTKYMGYDPTASTGESVGGGIDYGVYPTARTYTFGLNLNF
ncbi:MAG: TonB-dependent receptor [Bacteroidales bacterium]|nr:TonB-dependent receptor [Bacteroidales bacterium]MCF8454361.1 TonB-dependent receptor [Bacteroidales bacterium]